MSDRQNAKLAKVLTQSLEHNNLNMKDIERAMPCSSSVFDAAIPAVTAHHLDASAAATETDRSPMAAFESQYTDHPSTTNDLLVVGQSKLIAEIKFADTIPEKERRLIHQKYILGAQGEHIDPDETKWVEEILIADQT